MKNRFNQKGFEGKAGTWLLIITLMLLVLWIPVIIDKLTDFPKFRVGMLRQPFADWLGYTLIYTLPVLEIVTIILLIGNKTNRYGLYLSTGLMLLFTGYVGIAIAGAWEKLPCGCGSVITGMSWTEHFFFNLFFLALSIAGIYLSNKQRSSRTGRAATEGGSAKRQYNNFRLISKN